jgi:hypothetical protein
MITLQKIKKKRDEQTYQWWFLNYCCASTSKPLESGSLGLSLRFWTSKVILEWNPPSKISTDVYLYQSWKQALAELESSRWARGPFFIHGFADTWHLDLNRPLSLHSRSARTWRELSGTVSLQPRLARMQLEKPELSDLLSLLARSARTQLEKPELSDLLLLLARCCLA